MKRIASRDNPHFKSWRHLVASGGTQRDAGVAVVEGVHLCDAVLSAGVAARALIVGESACGHPEVAELVERATGIACYVLDDRLFAALSDVVHGVRVLMVIERPDPGSLRPIERTSVLLDRIQDPGNVGSILRSACAAGIEEAYLSAGCASPWSTKVLRAAMGAHFRMQLFEDCDLQQVARAATVPLMATTPHAAASVHEFDLTGRIAWLFGHEGQGVAPDLLRVATPLRIPQVDAVESLNVAAAAAICFFEQRRQRG